MSALVYVKKVIATTKPGWVQVLTDDKSYFAEQHLNILPGQWFELDSVVRQDATGAEANVIEKAVASDKSELPKLTSKPKPSASKYSEDDMKAFRRKEELIARQVAIKCSVEMTVALMPIINDVAKAKAEQVALYRSYLEEILKP